MKTQNEWRGYSDTTLTFDSIVDEFKDEGVVEKIECQECIAVVGFMRGRDVFVQVHVSGVNEHEKTSSSDHPHLLVRITLENRLPIVREKKVVPNQLRNSWLGV